LVLFCSLAFADSNETYFFLFGYVLAEIYVAMLPKVAKKASILVKSDIFGKKASALAK